MTLTPNMHGGRLRRGKLMKYTAISMRSSNMYRRLAATKQLRPLATSAHIVIRTTLLDFAQIAFHSNANARTVGGNITSLSCLSFRLSSHFYVSFVRRVSIALDVSGSIRFRNTNPKRARVFTPVAIL